MRSTVIFTVAVCIALALCLGGCTPNSAHLGLYMYEASGTDSLGRGWTTKHAIEFKSNGECVVSDTSSGMSQNIAGTYTTEGNTVTVHVLVLGTTAVSKAHFDANDLVTDDTILFPAETRLTRQQ